MINIETRNRYEFFTHHFGQKMKIGAIQCRRESGEMQLLVISSGRVTGYISEVLGQ